MTAAWHDPRKSLVLDGPGQAGAADEDCHEVRIPRTRQATIGSVCDHVLLAWS